MHTERASLTLVSFNEPCNDADLHHILDRHGFFVTRVPAAHWLESEPARLRQPLLFMLPDTIAVERVLPVLGQHGRYALAVFASCLNLWPDDFLNRFVDFLRWPAPESELLTRVRRLMGSAPCRLPIDQQAVIDEMMRHNMVGRSPAFVAAADLLRKAARCDAPVLLDGETGTGKELAARAIHYLGCRRDEAFVPVNCGAIPDDLLENELFGHERGAFTDARDSQPGLVSLAHGGTLFLDEVDSLSPKAQVALLRFLQDCRYKTLGGKRIMDANVRIIAASNSKLEILVKARVFREDLFFRLNLLRVTLPPLRERRDDIALLADNFISRFSVRYNVKKHLHPASRHYLRQRDWPGNVRELENLVHREFLLAEGDVVQVNDGATGERRVNAIDRRARPPIDAGLNAAKAHAVAEFERQYLCSLLQVTNGNVSEAARRAGKERRAFGKLLKRHGIEKADYFT